MKRQVLAVSLCMFFVAGIVSADTFATGDSQFTIDFVNISGDTNPASGYGIVNNDYRMGTYEISNDQWSKFTSAYGTVTGSSSISYNGYDQSAYWTDTNVPTNNLSWYEAAQFVNWLNTSKGHQAAYKFTGTQGQSDYTFCSWEVTDVGYNASNPFRNSEAFYFLPTENEWVKAAYWNGNSLQTYATIDNSTPVVGVDMNYFQNSPYDGPWDIGNGSEELNGTFDMMGNVWEWMESSHIAGNYEPDFGRGLRGGSYYNSDSYIYLKSSYRNSSTSPSNERGYIGFRVASVPEPCSLVLLGLGGLVLFGRKRV